MRKVRVARIENDGMERVRVFLSSGDELELLTRVECSGGVNSMSEFKIEGYIEGAKNDGRK